MIPKHILQKNKKKTILVKGNRGSLTRPRLSVFRSNRFIYAQLIDDDKGKTLVTVNSQKLTKDKLKSTKSQIAKIVGQLLAERAIKDKIKTVIFDRGKFKYHGQIKTLAEGARESGLKI